MTSATEKHPCDMDIDFYAGECPDYGSMDCPKTVPGAKCVMDMQYAQELVESKYRYYERKTKRSERRHMMTGNRTTELRDKLDALNIEHFDYDKHGRTQTHWEAPDGKRYFTYETSNNPAKTARLVIAWHPTPEQAIAATLGSERHAYEQRITGDGSDWGEIMIDAFDDLMASAGESCTPEQMRKLADYIRAGWTCHAESDLSEWVCSACQCWIPLGLTPENIKNASEWRYCPHCGAKVVGR